MSPPMTLSSVIIVIAWVSRIGKTYLYLMNIIYKISLKYPHFDEQACKLLLPSLQTFTPKPANSDFQACKLLVT